MKPDSKLNEKSFFLHRIKNRVIFGFTTSAKNKIVPILTLTVRLSQPGRLEVWSYLVHLSFSKLNINERVDFVFRWIFEWFEHLFIDYFLPHNENEPFTLFYSKILNKNWLNSIKAKKKSDKIEFFAFISYCWGFEYIIFFSFNENLRRI